MAHPVQQQLGKALSRLGTMTMSAALMVALNASAQDDSAAAQRSKPAFDAQLKSLIDDAIAHNPGLKAAAYKTEASQSAAHAARGLDPPSAAVEFFQSPIRTFPNPLNGQMEIDYSLQQMLPFPGKLGSMARAEESRAGMLDADRQASRQELVRLVKTAFYELYLIDRKLAINANSQALMSNFIAIARKQYELGMGKQTDILRAQTELSNLVSDSIGLAQSRQSMTAMLNSYRNEPAATRIAPIPEIPPPPVSPPALDSLLTVADNHRPELTSMRYNNAMRAAELTSAQREYLPDFMVRGTYKQMLHQPDDWALMLGVTLPVAPWSIGKYSAGVSRAKAQAQEADAQYAAMRAMIGAQVQDALAKVNGDQAKIDLIRGTIIPQARQTLQSAVAGYQTGKQEFLMLIDAQRTLLMAQQDYHMSVMRLIVDQADLERSVGTVSE